MKCRGQDLMSKNICLVDSINICKNRIDISYSLEGEWGRFFNQNEPFFVEYSEDISSVPKGVAVIPFICNILPIAWLCDADIHLPELDEDFYNSIPDFKAGYEKMYPMFSFKGNIIPETLILSENSGKNTAAFFSGGVDAFTTLIMHRDEKPALITLWGSDVPFEDVAGWDIVQNHTKSSAELFSVNSLIVKSSFRRFIFEGLLSSFVSDSGDGWWHGFQHGIGLIGHAAPYAYVKNVTTVYIASSNIPEYIGQYTCASDPTIDNYIRFCGCSVVHDGYPYSRQEKVRLIVDYTKKSKSPVPLRVCWISRGGGNCGVCEKCLRTIMEIVSEGANPNDYGFEWGLNEIKSAEFRIKHIIQVGYVNLYWKVSQKQMVENADRIENYEAYKWFVDMDLDKVNSSLIKRLINSRPARYASIILKKL